MKNKLATTAAIGVWISLNLIYLAIMAGFICGIVYLIKHFIL